MELLNPQNDFIFKRIFGSESNKDVLLAFLNRTFVEAGEPPLSEIVLMNPYTDKDAPRDKQSILDIRPRLKTVRLLMSRCSCLINTTLRNERYFTGESNTIASCRKVRHINS